MNFFWDKNEGSESYPTQEKNVMIQYPLLDTGSKKRYESDNYSLKGENI